MYPLLLIVGITLLNGILANQPLPNLATDPQEINNAFQGPNQKNIWWMQPDSPLKASYDYYKKCLAAGKCNPNQKNGDDEGIEIDLAKNVFLNGDIGSKSTKVIDLSDNPFLQGGFAHAANGDIIRYENGFIGVQPSIPFKGIQKTNGKAHSIAVSESPQSSSLCFGNDRSCVPKTECVNGVTSSSLSSKSIATSSDGKCGETEVCCRLLPKSVLADHINQLLFTPGKSKFSGKDGLTLDQVQILHPSQEGIRPQLNFIGEFTGSSTVKPIRDLSASANSVVFSNTPDYSDVHFDDDARYSNLDGPDYLPPKPETPTRPPPLPTPSCPPGQYIGNFGRCEPARKPCPPGSRPTPSGGCEVLRVTCPPGQRQEAYGNCVPIPTPPSTQRPQCGPGQTLSPFGNCEPIPRPPSPPPPPKPEPTTTIRPYCPPGQREGPNGQCISVTPACGPGQRPSAFGGCEPISRPPPPPPPPRPVTTPRPYCPSGQREGPNGQCVPVTPVCGPGQRPSAFGSCEPIPRPPSPPPPPVPVTTPRPYCPSGQREGPNGQCIPVTPVCGPGQRPSAFGSCELIPRPPSPPPPPVPVTTPRPYCPSGQREGPNGQCIPVTPVCGPGQRPSAFGSCEPIPRPPPPPPPPRPVTTPRPYCPSGQREGPNGQCVPVTPVCGPGQRPSAFGSCEPIPRPPSPPPPPVPVTTPRPYCPSGQREGPNGQCIPVAPTCGAGQRPSPFGGCEPIPRPPSPPPPPRPVTTPRPYCPSGQREGPNGQCIPVTPVCGPGQRPSAFGSCEPIPRPPSPPPPPVSVTTPRPYCPSGQREGPNGQCIPVTPVCGPGQRPSAFGSCEPIPRPPSPPPPPVSVTTPRPYCPSGQREGPNGQCIPVTPVCGPGQRPSAFGSCEPIPRPPSPPPPPVSVTTPRPYCPSGQREGPNGQCIPLSTCPPGFTQGPFGQCTPPVSPTTVRPTSSTPKVCPPGQRPGPYGGCLTIATSPPRPPPTSTPGIYCNAGQRVGPNGECIPVTSCPPGNIQDSFGQCIPQTPSTARPAACPSGQTPGPYGGCVNIARPPSPRPTCPPGSFPTGTGGCRQPSQPSTPTYPSPRPTCPSGSYVGPAGNCVRPQSPSTTTPRIYLPPKTYVPTSITKSTSTTHLSPTTPPPSTYSTQRTSLNTRLTTPRTSAPEGFSTSSTPGCPPGTILGPSGIGCQYTFSTTSPNVPPSRPTSAISQACLFGTKFNSNTNRCETVFLSTTTSRPQTCNPGSSFNTFSGRCELISVTTPISTPRSCGPSQRFNVKTGRCDSTSTGYTYPTPSVNFQEEPETTHRLKTTFPGRPTTFGPSYSPTTSTTTRPTCAFGKTLNVITGQCELTTISKPTSTPLPSTTGRSCASGEVLDSFTGRCRVEVSSQSTIPRRPVSEISCSFGQRLNPFTRKCESLVTTVPTTTFRKPTSRKCDFDQTYNVFTGQCEVTTTSRPESTQKVCRFGEKININTGRCEAISTTIKSCPVGEVLDSFTGLCKLISSTPRIPVKIKTTTPSSFRTGYTYPSPKVSFSTPTTQRPCAFGTIRNIVSGECEATSHNRKVCASGTSINPDTGKCERKITTSPPLITNKPCPFGTQRDQITGQCQIISGSTTERTLLETTSYTEKKTISPRCPFGTVIDRTSGQCVTSTPPTPLPTNGRTGYTYPSPKTPFSTPTTQRPCTLGTIRNPVTGQCERTPRVQEPCLSGTNRNPVNGQCEKIPLPVTKDSCSFGKSRNPVSGQCEVVTRIPSTTPVPRICPFGTRRNAKTGHCEPLATTIYPSTEVPSVPVSQCPTGTIRNPNNGQCERSTSLTVAPSTDNTGYSYSKPSTSFQETSTYSPKTSSVVVSCAPGTLKNYVTGKCDTPTTSPRTTSSKISCPLGTIRNKVTGLCETRSTKKTGYTYPKPSKPFEEIQTTPKIPTTQSSCNFGTVRNPTTGQCETPTTSSNIVQCPVGTRKNSATGECQIFTHPTSEPSSSRTGYVSPVTTTPFEKPRTTLKVACPFGTSRHPISGQCEVPTKLPTISTTTTPCPFGTIRNPTTLQCERISRTSPVPSTGRTGYTYPPQKIPIEDGSTTSNPRACSYGNRFNVNTQQCEPRISGSTPLRVTCGPSASLNPATGQCEYQRKTNIITTFKPTDKLPPVTITPSPPLACPPGSTRTSSGACQTGKNCIRGQVYSPALNACIPSTPSTNLPENITPGKPNFSPSSRRPGYEYPKPTPPFSDGSNIENDFIPSDKVGEEDSNIPRFVNRPTSPRPSVTRGPVTSTPFRPGFNRTDTNIEEDLIPVGCAAALKCVQEIYCTATGFISPVPVVLTKEQELLRAPTTVCRDIESGTLGKCCRDPNYEDPWPSANLVNGIDDGQYAEDDSIGQYKVQYRSKRASSSECGIRNLNSNPAGQIAIDANFAEIPWQAMILRESNRSLLCGGTIIKEDAVLTAAHCVEGLETSDVLIKGGEWKLGIDEEPLPFQIVKVAAILRHPDFKAGSLQNDLAILVLEENLRFTKNIGQICLSQPNLIPTRNCISTGWGKRILQLHAKNALMHRIDVNVMDVQQCQQVLNEHFPNFVPNYNTNTLCGFSSIDQCKIDYGSALACADETGRYTLSGVFAWDTGCRQQGQVGGYVAPDVEWIENILATPLKQLKRLDKLYKSAT
ncbi:hypothetical protein ABEB36_014313 [Hypothenemus hampei]|uniref:Peptidase S1 domain-containing protein n=1 Tax=Hypothenemus hampei TaxID=57062 RepID=A0ABD1E4Z5_HYPHA